MSRGTTTIHGVIGIELVTRQYADFWGHDVVFTLADGGQHTLAGFSDEQLEFGTPRIVICAPRDIKVAVEEVAA